MSNAGVMTVVKQGDPIEAAIAEAVQLYQQRYGCPPDVVKIHTSNPASVEAEVELEYTNNVAPGHALAEGA